MMTNGAARDLPGRNTSQTFIWAAALPVVALFAPLLLPLLTGRVFAHTDLGVFYLPMRMLYSKALAEGRPFLWSSQLSNGYYIHGEGQVGAFHPWHLLLYRTLPLQIAFNLELLSAYVFAFAGMWYFLRRIGLGAASRTVGATAFAFSGFFLLRMGHLNAIQVAAHIPWLLLAVDLTSSTSARERARGTAMIALLTGSQVLLGYPHYVWISTLACVTYALLRVDRFTWKRLWLPALGGMAGLMLGGIQLLPTLDLLMHSERANAGRSFQMSFSLHPMNLLQLFSPYVLPSRVYAPDAQELYVHEFGVYNGALCTIGVAWALVRGPRLPLTRTVAFAGVVSAVGVILALGKYGLVYQYVGALPFLRGFRAPSRHILLLQVGLSILAAIMYEDLMTARTRAAKPVIRCLGIPQVIGALISLAAVVWWYTLPAGSRPAGYPAYVLTGLGFIVVATLLVRDAARGVRAAVLVIPFFLAIDLGVWGYSYALGSPPMTVEQISALAKTPPGITVNSVHDAGGDPTINYFLFGQTRIFKAHVGLQPGRDLSPTVENTLRLAGVEWVRAWSDWRRVQNPMPRARIVSEMRASANPAADVSTVDIEQVALVEPDVPGMPSRSASARIQLMADEPGRMAFDVDASGPALLALTESYYRDWHANGCVAACRTVRLYGDYLGVVLAPGKYRMELTFEPRSFRYGAWLSGLGAAATLLLSLAVGRTRDIEPSS